MRLLHVVASGQRRGAEMFAADLVGALEGDDIDQRVAVLRGSNLAVDFRSPVSVLGNGGWRVPGVRVDRGTLRGLRDLIDDWRPDVVQVHGGEPLKHAVLAVRSDGPPLIYRRIGFAPTSATRGPRRSMYGWLMRKASRVVAVAEALGRDTETTFGVPRHRIVVIPNGADSARLEPTRTRAETRRALGIPPQAPVLLSLGALTWEKDPLAHLDIVRRVLAVRPDTVHLLVGEGRLKAEVEARIQRAGVRGRVLLLGAREDVPDLMAATDLLLLASRTEGAPGCLIEAGMAGVPVAVYGLGGVPEIVVDGVTGRLAPPGDTEQLAERVIELLEDPEEIERMGSRARERCRAFDIGTIAPMYASLYEELR